MTVKLVGFTGLKYSGKDTAAERLISKGYIRHAFADQMRDMLRAVGLTEWQLTEGKDQPLDWMPDVTPRDLLITLGSGWGRKMVSKDLWAQMMDRWLGDLPEEALAVITDVRFENEAKVIRDRGGIIIHVVRRRENWFQWLWRKLTAHESERGIKVLAGDQVVLNTYDKGWLWDWVDDAITYAAATADPNKGSLATLQAGVILNRFNRAEGDLK